MSAALTLAILYAISVTIVRIASVVLRHTGLPDHVARLQSISAVSGAGFTTTESELIVNHPLRRRVIVWLMVIGNLGFASVAATLIVTFMDRGGDLLGLVTQALIILVIVGVTIFLVNHGSLDRWMCKLISRFVSQSLDEGEGANFERLFLAETGDVLARHVFRCDTPLDMVQVLNAITDLEVTILTVSDGLHHHKFSEFQGVKLSNEMRLLAFGSASGQQMLGVILESKEVAGSL